MSHTAEYSEYRDMSSVLANFNRRFHQSKHHLSWCVCVRKKVFVQSVRGLLVEARCTVKSYAPTRFKCLPHHSRTESPLVWTPLHHPRTRTRGYPRSTERPRSSIFYIVILFTSSIRRMCWRPRPDYSHHNHCCHVRTQRLLCLSHP